MSNERKFNNIAEIVGEVVSDFEFSHESYGEGYYTVTLKVDCFNGTVTEYITVLVSQKLADVKRCMKGKTVYVRGDYRAFYKFAGKTHSVYMLCARDWKEDGTILEKEDKDSVWILGSVAEEPEKKKENEKEIVGFKLLVERPFGKGDILPCVTFGRNANFAKTLQKDEKIKVIGRIRGHYEKNYIVNDIIVQSMEEEVAYDME